MVADPCYGRRDTRFWHQANQYMDESTTADAPAWDLPLVGRELYDHEHDKVGDLDSAAEAVNFAGDDAHALVAANLSASLRYFFRVAQCTKTLCTPGEQAAARAAQGITTAPR